jgi:hypothetical protein
MSLINPQEIFNVCSSIMFDEWIHAIFHRSLMHRGQAAVAQGRVCADFVRNGGSTAVNAVEWCRSRQEQAGALSWSR